MRPLQLQCLEVHNHCLESGGKKIEFPRWPLEFPANQCRPIGPPGQMGRHWLASSSESHRGKSKIFAFSSVFYYFGRLGSEFLKDAFF